MSIAWRFDLDLNFVVEKEQRSGSWQRKGWSRHQRKQGAGSLLFPPPPTGPYPLMGDWNKSTPQMELLRFVGFNKLVLLPQHFFRDGPLFFWRGGGITYPEKNCLQSKKAQTNKIVCRHENEKIKSLQSGWWKVIQYKSWVHSLICVSKYISIF